MSNESIDQADTQNVSTEEQIKEGSTFLKGPPKMKDINLSVDEEDPNDENV